jgi:hypothetical protein
VDGAAPEQKLSAITTTSPWIVPLHETSRVSFVAAKPQYVEQFTVPTHQYGAQGRVAGQINKVLGATVELHKLLSTTEPAGLLAVVAKQCNDCVMLLSRRPQPLGQLALPIDHL